MFNSSDFIMASSAHPLVSVCIPAFRGAAHIAAAIESVLAQSLTDFELIIIDDHSADNTVAIAQGFTDARIRILKNAENVGPQGNWNRCLHEARGKYFKLLPQDDLLAPDCLKKQLAILEQDQAEAIALVFCARTIIDAHDKPVMARGYFQEATGIVKASRLMRHCLRRGTNLIGEPGSVLFRRKLASATGDFDARIAYVLDLDYWFRLLQQGDAYYLAENLCSFRVSRGQWSVAIGARQSTDYRRFIHKIAGNPDFPARRIDVWSGNLMAELNNCLRLLFYRFFLN